MAAYESRLLQGGDAWNRVQRKSVDIDSIIGVSTSLNPFLLDAKTAIPLKEVHAAPMRNKKVFLAIERLLNDRLEYNVGYNDDDDEDEKELMQQSHAYRDFLFMEAEPFPIYVCLRSNTANATEHFRPGMKLRGIFMQCVKEAMRDLPVGSKTRKYGGGRMAPGTMTKAFIFPEDMGMFSTALERAISRPESFFVRNNIQVMFYMAKHGMLMDIDRAVTLINDNFDIRHRHVVLLQLHVGLVLESDADCILLLDTDKMKQHLNIHGDANFTKYNAYFYSRAGYHSCYLPMNHPSRMLYSQSYCTAAHITKLHFKNFRVFQRLLAKPHNAQLPPLTANLRKFTAYEQECEQKMETLLEYAAVMRQASDLRYEAVFDAKDLAGDADFQVSTALLNSIAELMEGNLQQSDCLVALVNWQRHMDVTLQSHIDYLSKLLLSRQVVTTADLKRALLAENAIQFWINGYNRTVSYTVLKQVLSNGYLQQSIGHDGMYEVLIRQGDDVEIDINTLKETLLHLPHPNMADYFGELLQFRYENDHIQESNEQRLVRLHAFHAKKNMLPEVRRRDQHDPQLVFSSQHLATYKKTRQPVDVRSVTEVAGSMYEPLYIFGAVALRFVGTVDKDALKAVVQQNIKMYPLYWVTNYRTDRNIWARVTMNLREAMDCQNTGHVTTDLTRTLYLVQNRDLLDRQNTLRAAAAAAAAATSAAAAAVVTAVDPVNDGQVAGPSQAAAPTTSPPPPPPAAAAAAAAPSPATPQAPCSATNAAHDLLKKHIRDYDVETVRLLLLHVLATPTSHGQFLLSNDSLNLAKRKIPRLANKTVKALRLLLQRIQKKPVEFLLLLLTPTDCRRFKSLQLSKK